MTFDEWIVKKGHAHCWADMTKRAARAAWVAADRAAREECAAICETTRTAHCSSNGQVAHECAKAIRETMK